MPHIHPLEPIAVIVLVVIFFYLRRKQKQGGKPSAGARPNRARTAEEIYMDMRREALATTPQNLGREPKGTEPYGLLMEMAIHISAMTLVSFADGDANVYYKNGGGMVGGSSHESVRKAAKAFVALAARALPKMTKMTKTADYPLPGIEKVRFYVLTPQGVFTTETNRQALSNPRSELGALFYAGQEVVSEMRQVQEQKQGEKKPDRKVMVPGGDFQEPI
ncbi:MAG TPA: hypothetical protein VGX68_29490 [Thermoanaerobaculia bacterium]|jgi:hypothetical protein|nr:hypothetical protein [Thermoanaerobaculia bacterium]